jgi:hypothetical protein
MVLSTYCFLFAVDQNVRSILFIISKCHCALSLKILIKTQPPVAKHETYVLQIQISNLTLIVVILRYLTKFREPVSLKFTAYSFVFSLIRCLIWAVSWMMASISAQTTLAFKALGQYPFDLVCNTLRFHPFHSRLT